MFVYKGGEILGAGADIELLFGVKGGGSVAGASGKKIQQQLNNIIGNINKNPLGLKVSLNEKAAEQLKQSLLAELNSIKIESFDSSAAIAKLKSEVQSALNGVIVGGTSGSAKTSGGTQTTAGATSSAPAMTAADISAASDALKKYNSRLNTTKKNADKAKAALDGVASSIKSASDSIGSTSSTASTTASSGTSKNTEVTLQQIAALRRRAETLLNNNTKAGSMGYGTVLRTAIEQLDGSTIDVSKFDSLKRSIYNVELGLKSAGVQGKSFWSVLKSGYEKFGGWALITKSMTAAISAVKQMISNVTQLDAAMVELRKVTDESESTYEQFFDEATVRANKLGATVTDTINASAD